jgi:hypothetical protein
MPHQNSHIQFGKDLFSNSIYSSKICHIIYNFFYLINLGYAAPYPCHPLAPSLPTPNSQAGQNHGLGCQVVPLYIHDQSFQRRALGGRSSEETRRARAFYYCYYKADAGTNTACAAVRCLGLWVTRSQVLDPEYVCSVLQAVRLLSGCLVRRVKILVVSHRMFR